MKNKMFFISIMLMGLLAGCSDPTIDIARKGTANCYIVSRSGTYTFPTVKGNSNESVGIVATADVLWESFGTEEQPLRGNLIEEVGFSDGVIKFVVPQDFRKGNAVIAAKDASGMILWSWHIWMTDQPQEQVYKNNAGTMMDRNLGATSATKGDVGALGLLYQWGRKDPFLSSSSISESIEAKSTIIWPSAVDSNSDNGTISFAIANPTVFIGENMGNSDWYYTGTSSTDNTRWKSTKTIYDPCPAGWRVPDGGDNGVWEKSGFDDTTYDRINKGMSFSISSSSTTWYPASGFRSAILGYFNLVGTDGNYWSVTPYNWHSYYAYCLRFNNNGNVYPSNRYYRACGMSVRCLKE